MKDLPRRWHELCPFFSNIIQKRGRGESFAHRYVDALSVLTGFKYPTRSIILVYDDVLIIDPATFIPDG